MIAELLVLFALPVLLIAALVAVVIITGLTAVGTKLSTTLNTVQTKLN